MEKAKWTFERDLFGQYLADRGVKKLTSKTGEVLLVAWNVVSGKVISRLRFESASDYTTWMDAVVSDEDAVYNRSRALHCVLCAMSSDASHHACPAWLHCVFCAMSS